MGYVMTADEPSGGQPDRPGIPGDVLHDARVRARLTQQELATILRVSERTVQLWEKGRVPPGKEPLVIDALAQYLPGAPAPEPQPQLPGLASYSDMALIMELARRLEEARGPGSENPAGMSGGSVPNLGSADPPPVRTGRRGDRHP